MKKAQTVPIQGVFTNATLDIPVIEPSVKEKPTTFDALVNVFGKIPSKDKKLYKKVSNLRNTLYVFDALEDLDLAFILFPERTIYKGVTKEQIEFSNEVLKHLDIFMGNYGILYQDIGELWQKLSYLKEVFSDYPFCFFTKDGRVSKRMLTATLKAINLLFSPNLGIDLDVLENYLKKTHPHLIEKSSQETTKDSSESRYVKSILRNVWLKEYHTFARKYNPKLTLKIDKKKYIGDYKSEFKVYQKLRKILKFYNLDELLLKWQTAPNLVTEKDLELLENFSSFDWYMSECVLDKKPTPSQIRIEWEAFTLNLALFHEHCSHKSSKAELKKLLKYLEILDKTGKVNEENLKEALDDTFFGTSIGSFSWFSTKRMKQSVVYDYENPAPDKTEAFREEVSKEVKKMHGKESLENIFALLKDKYKNEYLLSNRDLFFFVEKMFHEIN